MTSNHRGYDANAYDELIEKDLEPSEDAVLCALEVGGEASISDLASRVEYSEATVRNAIKTLRDHELIDGRPVPGDARARLYRITDDRMEGVNRA